MTLLDAYALVALLADEPAADEVEQLLRTGGAAIVVVNLAEAIDVTRRVHELEADEVRRLLEPLLGDGIAVAGAGEEHAWVVGDIRAEYYDPRERPLSLADCFLLAAAGGDDAIATADPVVANVARALGVGVIALPDRAGRRP